MLTWSRLAGARAAGRHHVNELSGVHGRLFHDRHRS
jgi:hypothetical protein